jgi:hypothetical protein
MENEKPRIEFYRQRTFSEKLNITFQFIRENWKPLLKYSFYIIMPVCLIQTFATNAFFDTYMGLITGSASGNIINSSMYNVMANYGVMMLCMLIGGAIMSGLIYAMMQTYATRENRLRDVTLDDFKEILTKNTWKYLRIIFFILFVYLLIACIMILLAYISMITLFLTVPLLIAFIILLIPIMLVAPVYIFERDIKLFAAIKKAWILGTTTLWGMLGLMIVLYIISSVIQTVTMMPWYLTIFVSSLLSMASESTMNQSFIYKIIVYILGLIQSFGMYASMIISIIGLAFQYFHAREKVEGITIESNISNFDTL